MPSNNAYNNATTAAAAAPEHSSRDPLTHQLAAADAFHHRHQAPQAESLPCPRCDSKNTKFCYYNNYNLSQPRHFCKACRRYWTHGGTLRNVPIGGGTRKSTSVSYPSSNKRPRSSPATVSPCSASSPVSGHDVAPGTKPPAAMSITATGLTAAASGGLVSGFTSQLSAPGSNTFLALGAYGPGFVPALDGLGFGFGRGVWPFAEAGFVEGGGYGGFNGPMVCPAGVEAWHIGGGGGEGGGGGGLSDGEGFAWPELAISMPGQGLK